jgi:DNA replication protein DnaC
VAEIDRGLRATIRSLVAGESAWPLYLYGPPGTGKTLAALCLLDHAGGEFYTQARLAREYADCVCGRLCRRGQGGSYLIHPDGFWRAMTNEHLVVLDEFGAREKVSDHLYDVTISLLEARQGRPLWINSNVGLAAISQLYDDRVSSRIEAGTLIELVGADRRIQGRQA